jgi:hypothetical protein
LLTILLLALGSGLLGLAIPSPAEAQQVVRFSVQVLLASDAQVATAPVPPEELQQLIPKLQQLFRYRQYRVLQQYRGQAAVGGVQRWPIAGERLLEIAPESVIGNLARLHVRLHRGSLVEVTTIMMASPGAPAVIGGPRLDEGVLIVVVTTTP